MKRGPPRVWGYRNVWYKFAPSEASLVFPVSLGDLAVLRDCFDVAFATQREASFPAPDYDGPFSHWAQMIQADQGRMLRVLLGAAYFRNHTDPRVRAARGFVFVKEMTLDDLAGYARALSSATE